MSRTLKKLLLASALASALTLPARSAVTPNSFVTTQSVGSVAGNTTTSPLSLFTAGSNGAKCNGLTVATNSTTAVNVAVEIGGDPVSAVSVPAGSGVTAGVPTVAPLSTTNAPGLPVDSEGNPYLLLAASAAISLAFSGQSTGAAVYAFISCGNF